MSLSPVIGTEVPEEAPNGVLTAISPAEPCSSENGPHAHVVVPGSFKCGGSRLVPCPGQGPEDGPLGGDTENHVDHVETGVCDGEGRLDAEIDSSVTHDDLDAQPHATLLPSPHALLGPSAPTATQCTGGGTDIGPKDTELCPEVSRGVGESPGAAPRGDSPQHTESRDSPQRADPGVGAADRQQADTETVEVSAGEEMDGDDGEKEKQDEEDDEKREKQQRWKQHDAGSPEDDEVTQPSSHYSSAPCPGTSCASSSPPPAALLPADNIACPPHVMAQVRVRNVPERERIVRGMQDSKSLDEISQACGGHGLGSRGGGGRGGQSEGRRATISSALELEGTVSHDGDLTHFVAKNLELKIKMSSKPSLDCSDSDCSGPIQRSRGSARRPADIPPIDPAVLSDLQRHTQEVAHSVEMMMRSLNGTIQNMTALSVGYIQTYRDSVDGLGEAVDMSIKGMYTLMARCEELDRSMQPIHTLAAQIRDIKRTLDALEAICK